MAVSHFYVLLLSMILVGASAAGDYSASSNAAGEVAKPQSKAPSASYDKPVAQKMPKGAEESKKPTLESDPKSESYVEHGFQHSGDVEKPDFHFSDMTHSEVHSESYEKHVVPSMPKPEELGMPELEKDPKSESYDEPKFQHNEAIEKPDFHFPDMPHHQTHSESYKKPVSQWVPKPEESEMPALKDPKSESYAEPKFQHNEPIEKPDFHFPDMPHSTIHSASYDKPAAQWLPKPEESGMPTLEKDPKSESYDSKPVSDHDSKPKYKVDPHYETPKLNIPKPEEAFPAAVEGTVICKSPSGYVPIEGAVVRITCLQEDDQGYETTPVSCQTGPTDAKGYFFKTLPSNNKAKNLWENCKAFLEQSPVEECGVPSNVNRGIDGYKLSSHHILQEKHLKLYSVGPFFYTPEPKPAVKKAPAAGGGY
ncbi:unnamed protein product [Linum tenue]|uniref:Uncharacterized protein n=1 Tax=Linum tenue TaxID=586396 RepID=A0AAV0JXN1_9ROSI|nr:unnamed protein product [Linum tenue]